MYPPFEDPRVIDEVRRRRREYCRDALERVVREALAYNKEMSRNDGARGARRNKLEEALRTAIEEAFKAMHLGPATPAEIETAKEILNSRKNPED